MSVSSKPISDFFVHTGAAKYAMVATGVATASSFLNGAMNTVQDANTMNPNTWENAGRNASSTIGTGMDFMGAGGLGGLAYYSLRHGGLETEMNGVKGIMMSAEKGILSRGISKLPFMGGFGRPKGFMKSMSVKGGLAMFALPMLTEMALSPILGFAGKILDESVQSSRMMREIKYDNRFFDTNRYDQSTFQQVGQAMNNYQSKMVSMARIYHG
jgi:hypothetical protein